MKPQAALLSIPAKAGTMARVHPPKLQTLAAILAAALLLAWPACLNRYPLLYPDSVGYLQDGRAIASALFLHHFAGFSAQRSELYSLGIFPFHWNLTPWCVVALNALLTASVLRLVFRSILPRLPLTAFVAAGGLLSLLTSVSWYVSLLMPDILGALLYLCLYLLVFDHESHSRLELWLLSALAMWSITAHATHLMLAVGLWLLLAVLLLVRWPAIAGRGRALAHIALLIALAAAAQIGIHGFLYGRPSLDGSRPPYLMARIIADGPGRLYLERNCPALAWAICDSVHHLPDNDDDFLWDPAGVWSSASMQTQARLLAEEMPLVRATLRAYPRQQFTRSLTNFTQQLNDFGVNDFDNNTWMQAGLEGPLPGSRARYARSLQARDAVPSNFFTWVQRWVVILSAVAFAASVPRGIRRAPLEGSQARLLGLAVIILYTLFANALVTAVLSSSDSRYQARIIWLLPLLASLTLLDRIFSAGAARGNPADDHIPPSPFGERRLVEHGP